ncbi:MAG: hypothetical protein WBW27_21455, partial [Pseudolabrys sp.]
LQHISDALIASGYTTLDGQAKALGIHRATAWTIVKTTHKLGRLSAKTTKRILENPDTEFSACSDSTGLFRQSKRSG